MIWSGKNNELLKFRFHDRDVSIPGDGGYRFHFVSDGTVKTDPVEIVSTKSFHYCSKGNG